MNQPQLNEVKVVQRMGANNESFNMFTRLDTVGAKDSENTLSKRNKDTETLNS